MKKFLKLIVTMCLIALCQGTAFAILPIDLDPILGAVPTPLTVAQKIVEVGNGTINPLTVLYTGAPNAAGAFKAGLVDGLGIDNGVILTTGAILNAVGPNLNAGISAQSGILGDLTLDALVAPAVTFDASVLEFDFTLLNQQRRVMTIPVVFASDEYNEVTAPGGLFGNDVFGLFLDGVNIALVPGGNSPITVSNINLSANAFLFNNNDLPAPTAFGTQYDGFSKVLFFTRAVDPAVSHHLKIAIADTSDNFTDSAVFVGPAAFHFFADVTPAHFAFTQVEAVANAGISGGCQANVFCPDAPITRGQMAVFIETSLGTTIPPACLGNVFTDINATTVGATVCGFIEDFAAKGITGGCGGGNFCPNDAVTRGQMAVFIEAALRNAPNACGTRFADVTAATTGATACGFIDRLAADGITGGCTATNFCPNDPVTRAQMSVFIVAAPNPLLP